MTKDEAIVILDDFQWRMNDLPEDVIKAISKAIVALGQQPGENATNGDVIKKLFPNIKINDNDSLHFVYTGIHYEGLIGVNIDATKDWWNATYKCECEPDDINFELGDEVYFTDRVLTNDDTDFRVVIGIEQDEIRTLDANGCTYLTPKNCLAKTGKHYKEAKELFDYLKQHLVERV